MPQGTSAGRKADVAALRRANANANNANHTAQQLRNSLAMSDARVLALTAQLQSVAATVGQLAGRVAALEQLLGSRE